MRVVNHTEGTIELRVEQPDMMRIKIELPPGATWELPPSSELPVIDAAEAGMTDEDVARLARSRRDIRVAACFLNDAFPDGDGIEIRGAKAKRP